MLHTILSIIWLILSFIIILLILLDRDTSGGGSNIFTPSLVYNVTATSKGKNILLFSISISVFLWLILIYMLYSL